MEFIYSVDDQIFMQNLCDEGKLKDLQGNIATSFTPPTRCKDCRTKRKAFFKSNATGQ